MFDGCDIALYLSELLLTSFKTRGTENSTQQIVCVTDSLKQCAQRIWLVTEIRAKNFCSSINCKK